MTLDKVNNITGKKSVIFEQKKKKKLSSTETLCSVRPMHTLELIQLQLMHYFLAKKDFGWDMMNIRTYPAFELIRVELTWLGLYATIFYFHTYSREIIDTFPDLTKLFVDTVQGRLY